jgi:hypothetical protein
MVQAREMAELQELAKSNQKDRNNRMAQIMAGWGVSEENIKKALAQLNSGSPAAGSVLDASYAVRGALGKAGVVRNSAEGQRLFNEVNAELSEIAKGRPLTQADVMDALARRGVTNIDYSTAVGAGNALRGGDAQWQTMKDSQRWGLFGGGSIPDVLEYVDPYDGLTRKEWEMQRYMALNPQGILNKLDWALGLIGRKLINDISDDRGNITLDSIDASLNRRPTVKGQPVNASAGPLEFISGPITKLPKFFTMLKSLTKIESYKNLGQVVRSEGIIGAVKSIFGAGKSGLSAINGATRTVPHGFESEAQFLESIHDVQSILTKYGIDDAIVGVRGSSVTGFSRIKNTLFGSQSDIDFFIESEKLTQGLKTSQNIPGFVHPKNILSNFPELKNWSRKWSEILGRDITPGGFQPGMLPNEPTIIYGLR